MTKKAETLPATLPPTDNNPLAILARAVDNGTDVETLERLMQLSERHEANEARRAYDKSMAEFQMKCPAIQKKKAGVHQVKYAPLEDLQSVAAPVLSECGLSVTFSMVKGDDGNNVSVCTVRHELGHKESMTYPVIMPKLSGGANDAQQMAAANSYAIRNNYRNALNLQITGEDTDATNVVALVSAEQAANLQGLIDEVGADKTAYMKWLKVEKLSEVPATWYDKCIKGLEAKRKEKADGS